jgi:hypothetical protein
LVDPNAVYDLRHLGSPIEQVNDSTSRGAALEQATISERDIAFAQTTISGGGEKRALTNSPANHYI